MRWILTLLFVAVFASVSVAHFDEDGVLYSLDDAA